MKIQGTFLGKLWKEHLGKLFKMLDKFFWQKFWNNLSTKIRRQFFEAKLMENIKFEGEIGDRSF
jgi:hypothetical protein